MKKALAFLIMLVVAVTMWIAPAVPAQAYQHRHAGYYYYNHRWHAKPLPHHHWRYKKYRNHHYYYYY
ncbi:MAG: hypothetical protein ACP5SH_20770 [Syntrophobacteraceae bacterium]